MKAKYQNHVWGTTILASAAIAMLVLPQTAMAQDASEGDADSIITVTARRVTESLQDVPVTVTAVGKDTLDNFGVNQVADIASRVPTLSVQVGGSGSGGSISIRGVGSSAISAAFDSAVAFDFDGVVISTNRLVQAGFFDVQQIDVLKGPQSLYFGKSASAGVFSLRSAEPTISWEVGGKASYEFEERGYVIGGYASGPLSDTIGIRVAAQYNDVSRYNQIQPGIPAIVRNRGLKDFVSRVTLAWEPSDRFKANLKVNYVTNRNDGALAFQDVHCGFNGRADEVVLLQGAIAIPSGADCNNRDQFFAVSDPSLTQTTRFPDGSAGATRYKGQPFGETDIFFTRLKWDFDVTDALTLTSVGGYLYFKSVDFDSFSSVGVGPARNPNGVPVSAIAPRLAAVNTPGSAQGVGSSDPLNRTNQYSQELRLTSDFDGIFNFSVGAFYEYRKIDFNTSQQAVNISIIALDPVTGSSYDYYKQHRTKTKAYSVFGSASLDLSEKLQLTGGLRWTKESKVNTITVPYVSALLAPTPTSAFIQGGFFSGPIRFKDTNVSPEVSLRYKLSDDVNLYAAYKTGFKSGGIDNSALPSSNLLGFNDPARRDEVARGLIFNSETAKGGEFGAKMQFNDRAITLNASAFYYVFKDLQLQNFNGVTIQFVTFNASEVVTKGLDVDLSWRTPVKGLSISGSATYLHSEFTKSLVSAITGENLRGRTPSRSPRFSSNLAFDFETPVSADLEFGIRGNAQYSGSYFTANTSNFTINQRATGDLKQNAYATFDGSISIGSPNKSWKLALIGTNLANKIYAITAGSRPFLAGTALGSGVNAVPAGDDLNVNYNRGRQVFVEASFKF